MSEPWLGTATFEVSQPRFAELNCYIADFGASGNEFGRNTDAFELAITYCAEAGGGTVMVPAGIWQTGPIRLRSGVRLHLERGALIAFDNDPASYPLNWSHWEGNRAVRCMPLISGEGLHDVAITGEGIIDGGGEGWRPVKRFKQTHRQWEKLIQSGGIVEGEGEDAIWWPDEGAKDGAIKVAELLASDAPLSEFAPYRRYMRPLLLGLHNCERVQLEGVTLRNSPAWNVHLLACEQITVRGITVLNPWYVQNGDGLDLESCRHAIIEDCTFDVGDDAICMKSGKDAEGRLRAMPVEDVMIRRCTVYNGHGGFVIGSEMSGGVRRVTVEDCTFIGTDIGLRFKSKRGRGGVVEKIAIRRIRMKRIVNEAIAFDLHYGGDSAQEENGRYPVSEETPQFRSITMEDIVCDGAGSAIALTGLPEMPVNDIRLRNIRIRSTLGARLTNGTNIRFEQVDVKQSEGEAWSVSNCIGVEFS